MSFPSRRNSEFFSISPANNTLCSPTLIRSTQVWSLSCSLSDRCVRVQGAIPRTERRPKSSFRRRGSDLIPSPVCGEGWRRRQQQRVRCRQRRRDPADRHGLHDRCGAAGVIGVVVAENQAVQFSDAERAQGGDQDAVAAVGITGKIRAGVVEQCMLPGLRGDCQSLPDIEDDQAQRALLREVPAYSGTSAAA